MRQLRVGWKRRRNIYGEKTMTQRSDFLIHWTGKDIQTDYKALDDLQRKEYINRLRTTLTGEAKGLWMTIPEREEFYKDGDISFYYEVAKTCFTEIKLSSMESFTKRYGCLGFGFGRRFVLERGGIPVQYVSGTDNDVIVANIARCWNALEAIESYFRKRNIRDIKEIPTLPDRISFIREGLNTNICYMKNMSDRDHPDDFTLLDEEEWRIVKTKKIDTSKYKYIKPDYYISQPDGSTKPVKYIMKFHGKKTPEAWIPFENKDLKLLILPDPKTRQMALEDNAISDWLLKDKVNVPIILTIEDCSYF